VPDLPLDNYYLVMELEKKVPSVESVKEHFLFRPFGSDVPLKGVAEAFMPRRRDAWEDSMWADLVEQRFRKSRRDLMVRLRQEAGKVDAGGRFVIADEVKRTSGGGRSEE